jgi:hypothetical protein
VYDSPEGFQASWGHASQFKKVLIVHSPSANINNSVKAEVSIAVKYGPTKDELKLFQNTMLPDMSPEDFDEHIRIGGESLRFLSNPIHVVKHTLEQGVNMLVGQKISGLERIGEAFREVHRLIRLNPPADGNITPRLDFISQYVTDSVCAKFAENLSSQLLSFANCIDLHGTIRGSVFENRMYDFFLKAVPTKERAGAKLSFIAATLFVSGYVFISLLRFRHVTIFQILSQPKNFNRKSL